MSISASALALELSGALERDRVARAVDAAKKRALHTARSYGDFVDRVSVAGLTPVGRSGSLASIVAHGAAPERGALRRVLGEGGGGSGGGGGGVGGGAGGGGVGGQAPLSQPAGAAAPTTAAGFYRAWRAVRSAPGDAAWCELLRLAAGARGGLAALLNSGGDVDGVALGEMVRCAGAAVARQPDAAVDAAALLWQLAAARGFTMAAAMLSRDEAAAAAGVLAAAGDARAWGGA